MDVDGDGHPDLVSGSYTKGVFWFKNLGGGEFAEGKNFLDTDGKVVNPDSALAPAFADWDGDGDLDMVLGTIDGPVLLLENQGGFRFGPAIKLTVDGQPLVAPDGGPLLQDFSGDGQPDLLLGDGEGSLILYVTKSQGGIGLTKAQTLWTGQNAWEPRQVADRDKLLLKDPKPGVRLKPWVTDWNGDGKWDILVGDFTQIAAAPKKLTSIQAKHLKGLHKKASDLQLQMQKYYEKFTEAARKAVGLKPGQELPKDKQQEWQVAYSKAMQADKGFMKLERVYSSVYQEVNSLEAAPEMGGFVWVFLQQ